MNRPITIYRVIALTLSAPKMLIEGSLSPQEARPISIVGISQIAGSEAQQATRTGDWFGVLIFCWHHQCRAGLH